MTLVDTNIVIDVLQNDSVRTPRCVAAMSARAALGPLLINDIVYAELAAGFNDRAGLDAALGPFGLEWAPMSRDALALAGQAFRTYRLHGGARTNVLPDFFIGAQAQVEHLPILTRDPRRYWTYFPDVEVVGVE